MSKLVIDGGGALEGEVSVQGAKNSVLPVLAAAIMTAERTVIRNCPQIKDVLSTIHILRHLGCKVDIDGNTVTIDPAGICRYDIPDALMREMRSSVIFLGPMLASMRRASVSFPGGCELGPRPIDLHLDALTKMGVLFVEEHGSVRCSVDRLRGTEISLSFPSVGATENIMLAASLAEGETTVINAAKEPEIEELQNFLNAMGAKISGAGCPVLRIEGVKRLRGVEYAIMPDRIVAATYMAAAAATHGVVTVKNVRPAHLSAVAAAMEESGCAISAGADYMTVDARGPIRAVKQIRTMPYPGFPTDAMAPVMAYLTLAQGSSMFIETIFQSRYKHAEELMRLGARIKVEGNVAVVEGVKKLTGAQLISTDLRGGAALVVAGLAAQGTTEITEICHIERGYEDIAGVLSSLGGRIRKIN